MFVSRYLPYKYMNLFDLEGRLTAALCSQEDHASLHNHKEEEEEEERFSNDC